MAPEDSGKTTQASPTLRADDYVPADRYFGAPYIDRDEWREQPYPHRNVHGGFTGTDTRFTFYFPPKEDFKNRMFHPLEGGHAGHEEAWNNVLMTQLNIGVSLSVRLGGYMVESNSGHIGDDIDKKAGDDPTLYGHRASIESARFSKHLAAQIYGKAPDYSYVWGGSGGGRRSPLCLEYCNGVYQGALPYMGGGNVEKHGTKSRVRSEQPVAFGAMFNVQRLLRDKLDGVIDAMQPGGSGNPFTGLTMHERDELAALYRLGYPRGDEFMIANPMGQMWLWTSIADMLQEEDPDYFDAFWTKPGYVGHDFPELVSEDLIYVKAKVTRVISTKDLLESPDFAGPEFAGPKPMAMILAAMSGQFDLPVAVEVKDVGKGYRLGAGVRIMSGKAKGRQLYCMNHGGEVFFCDGRREANLLRFRGVEVGDEVHIDNRAFLAFCYYYRHHISADPRFDFLRIDGQPLYPQHDVPLQSPLMGVPYSGQYEGKLMWVHHTHDASLWPPEGIVYKGAVLQAQGPQKAAERFRLRWSQNAEHGPPAMLPSHPKRAASTWLIETHPVIEQCLVDLCDWVEKGIEPAGTNYAFADGKVCLPSTAAERGGIQPVVSVKANGGVRTEVKAGAAVTLEVEAEVPPNAGTLIAVEWDFDGMGSFPFKHKLSGKDARVQLSTTHTYDKPGTYFATARVFSHREGDLDAKFRRIPNLASARIVVR